MVWADSTVDGYITFVDLTVKVRGRFAIISVGIIDLLIFRLVLKALSDRNPRYLNILIEFKLRKNELLILQVPVSSIISCVDITSRFIVDDENSPEPFCEIDGDDETGKALFS